MPDRHTFRIKPPFPSRSIFTQTWINYPRGAHVSENKYAISTTVWIVDAARRARNICISVETAASLCVSGGGPSSSPRGFYPRPNWAIHSGRGGSGSRRRPYSSTGAHAYRSRIRKKTLSATLDIYAALYRNAKQIKCFERAGKFATRTPGRPHIRYFYYVDKFGSGGELGTDRRYWGRIRISFGDFLPGRCRRPLFS